jgi:RNA polymerase sigma factor (sigma-70 family)
MDMLAMGNVVKLVKPERGVAELITRLFRSHDRELRRYLQRMLGSKHAADEVAQDTYTKLFRLGQPEEIKCPRALLFDMATKQAFDYLKAERQRTQVVGNSAPAAEVDAVPDNTPRPDRQAAIEEAMGHLRKVIQELRPKYRPVFVLRYVHQVSHEQIGRLLNISTDAAQQRAAAALAECRSKFAELGIDPLALD